MIFSKDYNVELRCEKIVQIKGCEKFENDRQNDRKNDRRSRSDRITFFALSDRDLIGDHIFPSDRDLIGDHENGDRPELCILYFKFNSSSNSDPAHAGSELEKNL